MTNIHLKEAYAKLEKKIFCNVLEYDSHTKELEPSVETPFLGFIEHWKALYNITKRYGVLAALKYDLNVTFEDWTDLEEGVIGRASDKFEEWNYKLYPPQNI